MVTRKVSTMGFELEVQVPGSVEEYNSLAPKRDNPVLEDAVMNVLYRGILNRFRSGFLDALEKQTGVERINHGTEDKPDWEKDAVFFKRVKATVAQQRGLDPNAKSTEETLMNEWHDLAQSTIAAFKFDPSERESTGERAVVGKGDLEMAGKAIDEGKGEKLAALLSSALGRPVAFDPAGDRDANVKSLAVALKDRRAKLAKELEERTKAELAGV